MATNNSINTSNVALTIMSGTGALTIGNDATAKVITIGNTTSTTTLNIGTSNQTSGKVFYPFSNINSASPVTIVAGVNANARMSGSLQTLVLPVTSNPGDVFSIIGFGSGSWTLTQNAGQTIRSSTSATTTGVTGTLSPASRYQGVQLLCTVANTEWVLMGKNNGTLTFV